MADIQASIPIQLSSDNVTYKNLVCLKNYNVPITTSTNESETFCGKSVGVGAISFDPQGNAVVSTNPSGSELSLNQLLTWQVNKTAIYFKTAYPLSSGSSGSLGKDFYIQGQCYVTNINVIFTTNDVVNFDFTLKGFGDIDITA
jgi:hypothetical protein